MEFERLLTSMRDLVTETLEERPTPEAEGAFRVLTSPRLVLQLNLPYGKRELVEGLAMLVQRIHGLWASEPSTTEERADRTTQLESSLNVLGGVLSLAHHRRLSEQNFRAIMSNLLVESFDYDVQPAFNQKAWWAGDVPVWLVAPQAASPVELLWSRIGSFRRQLRVHVAPRGEAARRAEAAHLLEEMKTLQSVFETAQEKKLDVLGKLWPAWQSDSDSILATVPVDARESFKADMEAFEELQNKR